MKIFISYGHDEHTRLVRKFKKDLEKEGFEVWIDEEDIHHASKYDFEIEKGIEDSNWVVIFMTSHSLRRPGGVCLDEIAYAKRFEKELLPIMVQSVEPPLFLTRIQYFDFQKYYNDNGEIDELYYSKRLREIIEVLKGEKKILVDGEVNQLISYLNPIDNDIYIHEFSKDFYGREWFVNEYEKWLNNDQKRIFVLAGSAGSGKTSIIANLCHSRPEVQGIHFCKYNDNERANPKSVIMALAFHLATQIEAYRNKILMLKDLDSLKEKSIKRLFSYLITEPLYSIKEFDKKVVLIIDALDEADYFYRNELVDVVVNEFSKTPKWLKLLVSTRPEKDIMRKFATQHVLSLDEYSEETKKDLKGYLNKKLSDELKKFENSTDLIESIYQLSEGNFLYIKEFVRSIKEGHFTLYEPDKFPIGLMNVYTNYFNRLFNERNINYKEDYRRIFELVITSFEQINISEICDILNIDEYDIDDLMNHIHVLFPLVGGKIQPIHKSLVDWLSDKELSGLYWVSKNHGHKVLGDYYYQLVQSSKPSRYAYLYTIRHLIFSDKLEQAVTLMTDTKIINKRREINGLDTFSRQYINELELLYNKNQDRCYQVLNSDTLIKFIIKNRKYFYNSGLYFKLDTFAFNKVLDDNASRFGLAGELLYANYLYITERFSKTIELCNKILSNEVELTTLEKAEVYSILSMTYRKTVDFDLSNSFTQKNLGLGSEKECLYEKSVSNLMKGKIAFHRLDWDEAYNDFNQSIQFLEDYIQTGVSDDEKLNAELFIAEYSRVMADSAIWHKDFTTAEKCLERSQEIYTRLKIMDRYYVRYIYTSIFLEIFKDESEHALKGLDKITDKVESHYDQFQVLFYKAIILAKDKKDQEALSCIEEGLHHVKTIQAYLEVEELLTLKKLILGKDIERSEYFDKKKDIKVWVKYVEDTLKSVIKK